MIGVLVPTEFVFITGLNMSRSTEIFSDLVFVDPMLDFVVLVIDLLLEASMLVALPPLLFSLCCISEFRLEL